MKLTSTPQFTPLTLTIESAAELALVRDLFGGLSVRFVKEYGLDDTPNVYFALCAAVRATGEVSRTNPKVNIYLTVKE